MSLKAIASSFRRVPYVFTSEIKEISGKYWAKINKLIAFGPYETYSNAVDVIQGMVYNNSGTRSIVNIPIEDRAIWSAAWASTDAQRDAVDGYSAVVPQVWMVRPTTRFNPSSATTLSTAQMDQFEADMAGIPSGRRVLAPGFLFDGGLAGNDEVNDEFYKLAGKSGSTTWDSTQFNTPWPVEAATDMTNCWTDFITKMEARGLNFNYIADDQEQYQHFNFWNRAHIGPVESPDGYLVDPDARRVAALVNDARWSSTAVNDYGDTYSDIIKDYAAAIDGGSYGATSDEDMAAYYIFTDATKTTYRGATDFPTPFSADWGSSLAPTKLVSAYASRAANREAFAKARVSQMVLPVIAKPYFNGYFNYDEYNVTTASAAHSIDYNSHKFAGRIGSVAQPCVPIYGYNGSVWNASLGGKTSPPGTEATNPNDWYGWFSPGAGVASPTTRAFGAFLIDLHRLRLAAYGQKEIVGVNTNLTVWVMHPETTEPNTHYSGDPRYAYEAWAHAAVLGASLYMWFQWSSEPDTTKWRPTILQQFLDELALLTDNQKMLSCTNATASSTALTQKLVVGQAITSAAISGGLIQGAGSLSGQKLWRITVPPNIVNGSGDTLVTFTNIAESPRTISSGSRGCWVYSNIRPEVTVTAAP